MRAVTKKWVFLKVSSLILVPLMLWFALNLVSIYDKSYLEILTFLTSQPSKFIFSLFLIFAYFFSALSISEVFEDYIKDEKIKYVPLQVKEGDLAVFLQAGAYEVLYQGDKYFIVSQSSILMIERDDDLFN